MAVFDKKSIKGAIGNVSFSTRGNLTVARIKPGKGGVKQTSATKKSAALFGRAVSPFAKVLRMAFSNSYRSFYDRAMVNRMNSAVSTILYQHVNEEGHFTFKPESFQRIEGFNFNELSPLNRSLLVNLVCEIKGDEAVIKLPELNVKKDLKFPRGAMDCILTIQVAQFNLETGCQKIYETEKVNISKKQSGNPEYSFNYPLPKGSLSLASVAIEYFGSPGNLLINDKNFHPAGIFSAAYLPGKASDAELEEWEVMQVKLD